MQNDKIKIFPTVLIRASTPQRSRYRHGNLYLYETGPNPISNKNKTMRGEINIPPLHGDVPSAPSPSRQSYSWCPAATRSGNNLVLSIKEVP